jgi:hypothetical protein
LSLLIVCMVIYALQLREESFDYVAGLSVDATTQLESLIKNGITESIKASQSIQLPTVDNKICNNSTLKSIKVFDEASKCALVSTSGDVSKLGVKWASYDFHLNSIDGLDSLRLTLTKNFYAIVKADQSLVISMDLELSTDFTVWGSVRASAIGVDVVSLNNDALVSSSLKLYIPKFSIKATSSAQGLLLDTSSIRFDTVQVTIPNFVDWHFFPHAGFIGEIVSDILGGAVDVGLIIKNYFSKGDTVEQLINGLIKDKLASIIQSTATQLQIPIDLTPPPQGPTLNVSSRQLQMGNFLIQSFGIPNTDKLQFMSLNTQENVTMQSTPTSVRFVQFQSYPDIVSSVSNIPPLIRCGQFILYSDPLMNGLQFEHTKDTSSSLFLDVSKQSFVNYSSIPAYALYLYDTGVNYSCITLGDWKIVCSSIEPTSLYIFNRNDTAHQRYFIRYISSNQYLFGSEDWSVSQYPPNTITQSAGCALTYTIKFKYFVWNVGDNGLLDINIVANGTAWTLGTDGQHQVLIGSQAKYGDYKLIYTYLTGDLEKYAGQTVSLTSNKGWKLFLNSYLKKGDLVTAMIPSSVSFSSLVNFVSVEIGGQPSTYVNILVKMYQDVELECDALKIRSLGSSQMGYVNVVQPAATLKPYATFSTTKVPGWTIKNVESQGCRQVCNKFNDANQMRCELDPHFYKPCMSEANIEYQDCLSKCGMEC